MTFCEAKCILQAIMVMRIFWFFSPMLDSQILDDNESDNKVTNWVPTSISQKKKKKKNQLNRFLYR